MEQPNILDRITELNNDAGQKLILGGMMGLDKDELSFHSQVMEVTKLAYNELSKTKTPIVYDTTNIETADFRKQLDFLTYLMISIQHNLINGNNNEPNEQFQFTNDILDVCRKYKEDK